MKKQLFSLILSGLLLLSLFSFAQNNNYPDTTVNGIHYFQYTVQQGDGLLSIGRKFKLSQNDIIKPNPELKDGLKTGQQILIINKTKPGKKILAKPNSKIEFIHHKVQKKQTLFSIARKYNVSEEDIIKYNPEIEKGLKEGIEIQIPKPAKEKKNNDDDKTLNASNNTKTKQEAQIDKKQKYITHKVQPDETLFSISRRYKVDIPDIIKLNPGSQFKLAVGSDLKIPSIEFVKSKEQIKDNLLNDTKSKNEIKIIEKSTQLKFTDHKTIKIAYLLPLMVDQVKKDPGDERFINFYEGSLLAINEAKQKGISFEIFTFDTDKSEDRIKEILNSSDMKSVDLIIGPAYSSLVPYVENFAKVNKINTLIPFTSKVSDIDTNPYLFQFNPGQDSELDFFYDLISGKYKNVHLVFAEIQDVNPTDEGNIRFNEIQKKLTKDHRSFSNIELSASNNINLSGVLKKGEKNLIIFNSDKFSNVSPFINLVSSQSTLYDIVLFEQFNWRNQTDKSIHTFYLSPFITKFNPVAISDFNRQFNQFYGKDITSESPRFDLLGYDLSNYFISLIHRSGNKFSNKINSTNFDKGIQSDPLFERSSNNSGFINQRVYLGEDKAQ